MRQRLIVLTCVIGSMVPSQVLAQATASPAAPAAPITVEQLVAMALDRGPGIQAQRLAIARANGDAEQAALRANPTLSTEQREEVGGTDRMTSLMVEWPLELFRRNARVAAAKTQVGVAGAEVAEAERQLAGDVRRRAVELLAAERRAAVTDEIAASLHDTYESLSRRVEEGASPPLLRDQAYVEWQRAEAQRPMRRADVSTARAELRAAVGLPMDAPLAVADDLAALGQKPAPASLGVRADIRQATARVTATTALADSIRQQGRFDLGVFGGYTRMTNSFPQFGLNGAGTPTPIHGQFNNLSLGISVMLPIANRNQGATAAVTAEVKAAEFRQTSARLNADAEVAAARARDEEAGNTVKIYDNGLRTAARKNLDVVTESFSLGRMTLADVLTEQRRRLDVEMAYVDALAAAALARTNLLLALGVTR
jgi:cobalt-zinc-cadmium efflux system outer membrane protein